MGKKPKPECIKVSLLIIINEYVFSSFVGYMSCFKDKQKNNVTVECRVGRGAGPGSVFPISI